MHTDYAKVPFTMKHDTEHVSKETVDAAIRERMRAIGRSGGFASARNMTVKQRKTRARKAARARWGNRR